MNVNLTSTTRIVHVGVAGGGDIPGRVWEGVTESGIPVFAVITRIAVPTESDTAQFERELERCADPSPASVAAVPLWLIL